jgi:alkylmercury lyase
MVTTVDLHRLTDEQLTDHLVAWFKQTLPLEEHRRLIVPSLQQLATAQPVAPHRLAALAGMPVDQTLALLQQAPSEWDPSGTRLVGLGLTSKPTRHRFQVHGHSLYTWCAVDAIFFPVLIGAPARIQSPCVATGDLIQIDLTPAGVEQVEPSSAVVSMATPAVDVLEVRRAVCAAQHFFRSADAASRWQAEHPQALLLSVTDMFQLYRRVVGEVWGDQLPG